MTPTPTGRLIAAVRAGCDAVNAGAPCEWSACGCTAGGPEYVLPAVAALDAYDRAQAVTPEVRERMAKILYETWAKTPTRDNWWTPAIDAILTILPRLPLPAEVTGEMVDAAWHVWDRGEATDGVGPMLRAALAAAPRDPAPQRTAAECDTAMQRAAGSALSAEIKRQRANWQALTEKQTPSDPQEWLDMRCAGRAAANAAALAAASEWPRAEDVVHLVRKASILVTQLYGLCDADASRFHHAVQAVRIALRPFSAIADAAADVMPHYYDDEGHIVYGRWPDGSGFAEQDEAEEGGVCDTAIQSLIGEVRHTINGLRLNDVLTRHADRLEALVEAAEPKSRAVAESDRQRLRADTAEQGGAARVPISPPQPREAPAAGAPAPGPAVPDDERDQIERAMADPMRVMPSEKAALERQGFRAAPTAPSDPAPAPIDPAALERASYPSVAGRVGTLERRCDAIAHRLAALERRQIAAREAALLLLTILQELRDANIPGNWWGPPSEAARRSDALRAALAQEMIDDTRLDT